MILVGNQRGGAKDLALHLMKEENEHVEVHELRGFTANSLMGALNEVYAVSRGTRCKQFLYSLSLNPPKHADVATEQFEAAIDRVEERLGLAGQPRAIVFHEKEGRRHAHAVWSRIDTASMKAVQIAYDHRILNALSRELYLEHGWTMPRGLMNSKERDPRNFTLAEWQQAKRTKKNPREIKTVFQDCWAVSDTQGAFAAALRERAYMLAKGDRRGFVALDHRGEPFAVSKWVGIRIKEVRAKLQDADALPSVAEARTRIAKDMTARLNVLREQHQAAVESRQRALTDKRRAMIREHVKKRRALTEFHEKRSISERAARQARFNKGLCGLFDRLTGQHRRLRKQNEREAWLSSQRDRQEKDALIFQQLQARRTLENRIDRLDRLKTSRLRQLDQDIARYQETKEQRHETLPQRPVRGRRRQRNWGLER